MNLQERIEALETEFADKIKTLKAEAQREDKFTQDGDCYWYIDSDGEVLSSDENLSHSEEHMLEVDNVFKTKEQAEFAVEKLKVEAGLRKFSRPFNRGECNYIICIGSNGSRLFTIGRLVDHYQGAIYFDSAEKAEEAIETVGAERIKKYIFGVED